MGHGADAPARHGDRLLTVLMSVPTPGAKCGGSNFDPGLHTFDAVIRLDRRLPCAVPGPQESSV